MRRLILLAACSALTLAGWSCGGERKPPAARRVSVLPLVLKIPGSAVLDTSGGEDADRMVLSTPVSADSVARFYRSHLSQEGWRIQGDRSDTAETDIYATRGGSQLWVRVERSSAGETRYTLIGALGSQADTTAGQRDTAQR